MNTLTELRRFVGRVATVLWIEPEKRLPKQALMMLVEAELQLVMQPLLETVPLHSGQLVRVMLDDPATSLRLRFNSRVIGRRGEGFELRPPAEMDKDRRHFDRVPLHDPLTVRRIHERGWLPVEGVDISLGGLAFVQAIPYRMGEQIAAQVTLLPAEPFVVTARIVRVEGQQNAAAFERLSPTAHRTISAFVLRYLNG